MTALEDVVKTGWMSSDGMISSNVVFTMSAPKRMLLSDQPPPEEEKQQLGFFF